MRTLSHGIAKIPTTRHTIETAAATKMMRQSLFIRICAKATLRDDLETNHL
jgi:hypothetical protein